MRQVTLEAMEALLLRYKGRYTTVVCNGPRVGGRGCLAHPRCTLSVQRPADLVCLLSPCAGWTRNTMPALTHVQVGFCPTGWSQGRLSKGLNKRGRRSQHGTVVLYQVRC